MKEQDELYQRAMSGAQMNNLDSRPEIFFVRKCFELQNKAAGTSLSGIVRKGGYPWLGMATEGQAITYFVYPT